MRKLIFVGVAALVGLPGLFTAAFAKKPITVKFKERTDNVEVAGLLGVLDAYQITTTLYADFIDADFYAIWMVNCKGDEKERSLIGYTYITPDSTTFSITAMPIDSLNLAVYVSHCSSLRRVVSVPTTNRLLVSCNFEWEFNTGDTIPLMAYTTGIPTKFDYGDGKVVEGVDICGLRYSKILPLEWQQKYDLPDYIYFEAIPTKEMSF